MKTARTLMALVATGVPCGGPGLTGCKQEPIEPTTTEEQIDQQLAEKVKVGFGNSPAFKFPDVQVASFKGKIQLSGFVLSEDQKSTAETIAKGIPGVVKVENGISIKH